MKKINTVQGKNACIDSKNAGSNEKKENLFAKKFNCKNFVEKFGSFRIYIQVVYFFLFFFY